MQTSLALTALIMGLAGGPHCVAMCGAACAGMGQVAGDRMDTPEALLVVLRKKAGAQAAVITASRAATEVQPAPKP